MADLKLSDHQDSMEKPMQRSVTTRRILVTSILFTMSCAIVSGQKATLRKASLAEFPGATDCNSPAHWKDGNLYLHNSAGLPVLSRGPDQFHLGHTQAVFYDHHKLPTRWIESTYLDDDGTVYGWYHHEPGGLCPGNRLTSPKIGALRSKNNGGSYEDLGVVLEAPGPIDCNAKNGYFAGGNGDFTVILDRNKGYFYFLISTYHDQVAEQGVAVARMSFADRNNPVGKVWKYHKREWREPGLGGHVTPIFPAKVDWKRKDADSLWGPSLHWNTYLEKWVMLLNRTCCSEGWPQEGLYVSFNANLANPTAWSQPVKILEGAKKGFHGPGWYPQVLGLDKNAKETDKLAGKVARFYLAGRSEWEIVFEK